MSSNESFKKISSVQNPLVKHLVKIRENSHYRNEAHSVLVTSVKVIYELTTITIPKRVFFTEGFSLSISAQEYIVVSEEVLKKITHLPTPEGMCAEFVLPSGSSLEDSNKILALDQLSDPGNLGTLVRTATAFNWDGIFFLPNCVDPFHEKVIRASRGALFKIRWKSGSWQELEELKEKNRLTCFIADLNGKKLQEIKPEKKIMLLLSNEASGVSKEAKKLGEKVTIPMSKNMESLNVAIAGGILMYGLAAAHNG